MGKKNGFTLVELLATIIILGIIVSIVGYVAINAINKSKEKSYKVTINEIEKDTNNYLMENSNRLFFLTNNDKGYEYQCVMVENLVDYGYLNNNIVKSNVSKNDTVSLNDYIYIERNKDTKSIEKVLYTKTNPEYINICGKAVNALGDIVFSSNPGFNEWSKYKDITITYKLKNLNDQRTLGNYIFNHSYDGESVYNPENDKLENNIKTKIVRVTSNGEMNADIKLKDETIVNASIEVDKIDIVGPVVSMGEFNKKKVHGQVVLPLKVTDYGIGVNNSSFTKDDIIVKVNNVEINDINLEYVSGENFNLTINNNKIDGNIKIYIGKDKIFDKLENGNNDIEIDTGISFENIYIITYDANGGSNAPSATTYTYSTTEKVNLSNDKPIKNNYYFAGWSTDKNATTVMYEAGGAYPRNITENITLYAIWYVYIQQSWDFAYIKAPQEFIIPYSGTYKLEVWGAQGGKDDGHYGGKGGYSVGYVELEKNLKIYVVVGGSGGGCSSCGAGGYNGGGSSGVIGCSGSGGGATHIGKANAILKDTSPSDLYIVAGGGGGAGWLGSCVLLDGGAGGGTEGNSSSGSGGTQSAGGSPGGSYGQGGNRCFNGADGGGGGGGYYGGGGSSCFDGGGGGGSGYIGGVTDGSMIKGNNSGNGKAKITFDGYVYP